MANGVRLAIIVSNGPIKILQIGDIHYPDALRETGLADVKDKGFSPELVKTLTLTPFSSVMRKISSILRSGGADAMLLMGDITSRGDQRAYEDCILFLKGALLEGVWDSGDINKLMVVPGNHDVNRKDYREETLFHKFEPLKKILARHGLRPIPVSSVEELYLERGNAKARILSINSCIGCGEKRYLPSVIQDELFKIIGGKISDNVDDEVSYREILNKVCEHLDTPAVLEEVIHSVVERVTEMDLSCVPLIAAHHGIVPQVTTRVDVYTELINGGQVRKSLLETNRPIIFLHGHVHTDPIEVISDPAYPKAQLILISAPLLSKGFNVIELHFDEHGTPMGCRVEKHRQSETGQVIVGGEAFISLCARSGTYLSPIALQITKILADRGLVLFGEIKHDLQNIMKDDFTEDDIIEALNKLRWWNIAQIEGHDNNVKHWRISRVI